MQQLAKAVIEEHTLTHDHIIFRIKMVFRKSERRTITFYIAYSVVTYINVSFSVLIILVAEESNDFSDFYFT